MSISIFLLHAHDHLWKNKKFNLKSRIDGCDILWKLSIKFMSREEFLIVWDK